ncbi:MAG TPA: response regulator [Myxococcales bacterium]|nr:response regulator [Myxococcales bacterium]HIK86716.1 response regulator [Myxococcales bacterium]
MVAGCPKCSVRYRVDPDRIGPDGAKLRCTKCSAVFLVRVPRADATPSKVQPVEPEPQVEPEVEFDSTRLVVIADPDEARGKSTAEAIRSWGLSAILVHDGVEAMLSIQRTLPTAIILDAALPKMFGFQVCEVVKRNESLRDTTVILVGAIHHQEGYRRDPTELYGADVYIEDPDLPNGLNALLRDAGMDVSLPETGDTASAVEVPTPPQVVAPPATGPAIDEDPERTAERERAHRLARIAVSEMVLYQPEKFDQARRDGVLEQALGLEIQEARALLRQRIGEEVRAESDFIIDELHRVAKERGEQA